MQKGGDGGGDDEKLKLLEMTTMMRLASDTIHLNRGNATVASKRDDVCTQTELKLCAWNFNISLRHYILYYLFISCTILSRMSKTEHDIKHGK